MVTTLDRIIIIIIIIMVTNLQSNDALWHKGHTERGAQRDDNATTEGDSWLWEGSCRDRTTSGLVEICDIWAISPHPYKDLVQHIKERQRVGGGENAVVSSLRWVQQCRWQSIPKAVYVAEGGGDTVVVSSPPLLNN